MSYDLQNPPNQFKRRKEMIFNFGKEKPKTIDEECGPLLESAIKSGDIYEYIMPKGTKAYLIIKNHQGYSTALALKERINKDEISFRAANGKTYYVNPKMVQYVYNDGADRFIASVPEEEFNKVKKAITNALSLPVEEVHVKVSRMTIPDQEEKKETVNHPEHYQGKHECIEEMRALFGGEAVKAFCKCNVYKYRYRASRKGGEEDLDKADFYMDYLMEMEKQEDPWAKAMKAVGGLENLTPSCYQAKGSAE